MTSTHTRKRPLGHAIMLLHNKKAWTCKDIDFHMPPCKFLCKKLKKLTSKMGIAYVVGSEKCRKKYVHMWGQYGSKKCLKYNNQSDEVKKFMVCD